jgi:hypothetical protein
VEVLGPESFALQRQTNFQWRMIEPQDFPVDLGLLREFMGDLLALEATEFEKDVVTDFTSYGLTTPERQIILKTTLTNATSVTNLVLAQVDFGTNAAGKLFARRPDENSVYAIKEADYVRLPTKAWQLRDRQVWNFAVSNVVRVTITQAGRTQQLVRNGTNDWAFGPGSQGIMNPASVERAVGRLGALQAPAWEARGPDARARYGFAGDGYQLAIEVRNDDTIQTLTLETGGLSRAQVPYAAVMLEGQVWIFELPWIIYQDLLRDLSIPKLPGTTARL